MPGCYRTAMGTPGGQWIVRLCRSAPEAGLIADQARAQGAAVLWCGRDCPACAGVTEENA